MPTDQQLLKFQASTNQFVDAGMTAAQMLAMQTSCADSASIIAAATSGTTSQYMRGNGTLAAFPAIPSNTNQLTNGAGFITGITGGNVTAALGFTPYNASNPNSFIDLSGARAGITFTTTGTGAASYNTSTGALNIPTNGSGTVTSVTAGAGLSGGTITSSGTISMPNTGTAGSYSRVTTDAQGRVTAGTDLSINDSPGRSIVTTTTSTGFQIDASRACEVHYDIDLSTTASIAGNASATVYLETAATNSTTAGDWTTIGKVSNSQALSLAVALQSIQGLTQSLNRKIPPGKYVRIRSAITGTASASIAYAQEIKL